jgi:lysophospholipase L1-like esterase
MIVSTIKKNFGPFLGFFLIYFGLALTDAVAQMNIEGSQKATGKVFNLNDGDKVVFLGNSLFENDLQFGYLELLLTTRWPQQNITFRNLGWSGDTVFGQARTYITAPSGYDLLIKQLKEARPTVVFLAYGANEAFEGEKGIPVFAQGLNRLLNAIDELGAKSILLSTVPMLYSIAFKSQADRNEMLKLYNTAIYKIAAARRITYIDVFNPLLQYNQDSKVSDNGIHLNEYGYSVLAASVQKELGLPPSTNQSITIDVATKSIKGTAKASILALDGEKDELNFQVDEAYLPLPGPQTNRFAQANVLLVKIDGLKDGNHTLFSGSLELMTASAKVWAGGVEVNREIGLDQANMLRKTILKKNEMFFHQYRPMNRTYIIGFRSHEQGRHAEGLEDLSTIIEEYEKKIFLSQKPEPQLYQLKPTQ